MNQPRVGHPFPAPSGVDVLPTYWPVPGLGVIPMNAFLLHCAEPVLVDTGTAVLAPDFLDALADRVKLTDLKWIWLTHEDRDHTGALGRLLELAPQATVLGTFLTFGRAAPDGALPFDRTRIVNPGDDVDVGDRVLRAVRPPLYDSPGTLGFLDRSTGAYFSSDCFGAPLPADLVAGPDTDHIDPDVLRSAQVAWAGTDSPWVADVDGARLRTRIEAVRRLGPSVLLSSHLPPVRRGIDHSLDSILAAGQAEPVPAPTHDQIASLLDEFDAHPIPDPT
ncbi:Putative diflavin flavoprotein A 3 [Mycolicibacterium vanbaalenii]|uniref:Diflavin flavoprotein A 3 n=1 Tax=Mycolicibacterium vanbaalenii TaxID=110539 RepID=A0A5S9QTB5_MYCVN|nr:MBL fold metallo-hydrolase [Mycolicibacterium vanbaalenii]CAA0122778.1 Putative diflavin flavoprotein A 3 [Mycolicibacterium vanbaalenii]